MVALVRWHEWVWRELGSQERNGGRGRAIRFLIETFANTECSIFETFVHWFNPFFFFFSF